MKFTINEVVMLNDVLCERRTQIASTRQLTPLRKKSIIANINDLINKINTQEE